MRLKDVWQWGLAAVLAGSTAVYGAIPAAPGVLNFLEGQTQLNGEKLSEASVGSAQMQDGNTLTTTDGRAEILMSPGVFLRLGRNSELQMISSSLLNPTAQLTKGNALVEAASLKKESGITILVGNSQTVLMKKGLYRFNADNNSLAVYDGKARVTENGRSIDVKGGHETTLSGPLASRKFDKDATERQDTLYAWSKLRSEYLSEASASSAHTYIVDGGWYGSGWYWNPWYRTYAWLPGSPYFYSPFGLPYYSPWAFGFYGPGYYGVRPRGLDRDRGHDFDRERPHTYPPAVHPGFQQREFVPRGTFHQGMNPGFGRGFEHAGPGFGHFGGGRR
jgi:hypothetical protein